jgi:photosystem II stability/assembly factor-like uncharacterized protein
MFGAMGIGAHGVLVYGVAGQAYISNDDGQTWTSVALGATANLTSACKTSDGSIVIADEYGNLYVSRNQGKTFTQSRVSVSMAVFDLIQAADGTLVAVGNAGVQRVPAAAFAAG